MIKEYHFVKPKPATKEILKNKNVFFEDKFDGISIESFIDENSNLDLYGRGVLDGKEIKHVSKMSLKDMQEWVGGYIEVRGNMIFNEEGLILKLERNVKYPTYVGNIIIKDPDQNM